MKNLFVDTNVFLRLYSVGEDYPDLISDLIDKVEMGEIKLFITQQVVDEFNRNRETKIMESLKRIKEFERKFSIPSFCKQMASIRAIKKRFDEITSFAKRAHLDLQKKALSNKLQTDKLFIKLFKVSKIIDISSDILIKAKERVLLGNPPGKNNSYGDAINWEILLEKIPSGEDLFLISGDGDYLSKIDNIQINSFLKNEWKRIKKSSVIAYDTLSRFLKEEFGEDISDEQIVEEEKVPIEEPREVVGLVPRFANISGSVIHSGSTSSGALVVGSPAIGVPSWGLPVEVLSPFVTSNEKEIKCSTCGKIFYQEYHWRTPECPYCHTLN